MPDSFLCGAKAPTKILFTIFVMLVSYLSFSLLSVIIAMPLFHLGFNEISSAMSDYSNPDNLRVIKYFQLVQSISLFIIPALLVAKITGGGLAGFLNLRTRPAKASIILTILIILVSIPCVNYLVEINSKITFPEFLAPVESWLKGMEEKMGEISNALLGARSTGEFAYNILLIAVIPALGEELMFRGVFQKFFSQWFKNVHAGIMVTAFLFSALHFQFYGMIPRMFLGVFFGYLLVWSNSLWLPVTAHFINNAAAVFYYYFSGESYGKGGIDKLGQEDGACIYITISCLLIVIFFYAIYKTERGRIK